MKEINGVFLNKEEWDDFKRLKQLVDEIIFYYKNNPKKMIAQSILDPNIHCHLGCLIEELYNKQINISYGAGSGG